MKRIKKKQYTIYKQRWHNQQKQNENVEKRDEMNWTNDENAIVLSCLKPKWKSEEKKQVPY